MKYVAFKWYKGQTIYMETGVFHLSVIHLSCLPLPGSLCGLQFSLLLHQFLTLAHVLCLGTPITWAHLVNKIKHLMNIACTVQAELQQV